jgi:hypothetical protein
MLSAQGASGTLADFTLHARRMVAPFNRSELTDHPQPDRSHGLALAGAGSPYVVAVYVGSLLLLDGALTPRRVLSARITSTFSIGSSPTVRRYRVRYRFSLHKSRTVNGATLVVRARLILAAYRGANPAESPIPSNRFATLRVSRAPHPLGDGRTRRLGMVQRVNR